VRHPDPNPITFARHVEPPRAVWTHEQWQRIRLGHISQDMDDRWDVFVDGAWLHFQRSWTGFRVYSVRFVSTATGWTIAEAVVTGDHRKYQASPPPKETAIIEWLVEGVLLGNWDAEASPFSADEPTSAPLQRSIWIEPGWLLAGFYPGDLNPEVSNAKLDVLQSAGIRHIIDLTRPEEHGSNGKPLIPYSEQARSKGFSLRRVPLRSTGIPDVYLLRDALDEIEQALAAGRPTYVHDLSGRGRSLLVAGCWLLWSGQAKNDDVLERLTVPENGAMVGLQLPERSDYRNFLKTTHDFDPTTPEPKPSSSS
jgi:hypothetical protein